MSPPRPDFFDASYASLWDLLPQALHAKLISRDISANVLIDTLGQKFSNLSSYRYTSFVQKMIENNAGAAGENYRLDNIIDTFARDSNDQLNPTDFTPITNFLEWNIFDASNSYLDGFDNYLRGETPFKRASLQNDMTEALTSNTCFFAVLVLGQIPIQTILNKYYPDNTYTEFVQSVVYAGTTVGSAIYSDPSVSDGYGIGLVNGVDPTAFKPDQYNFGNLRLGIDTLPDRITAIDMWAAATPSKWSAWTANVGGFLSFVGQVFQYHTNNNITDDADLIKEFASTGAWDSTNTSDQPGFANEFAHWLTGGYDASGIEQQSYSEYDLNAIYANNTYTYDNKSYNLVYDSSGNKSFIITVITLLVANINVILTDASGNVIRDASGNPVLETVTIDQILDAFSGESAPSMFYKGYAPAQYLRKLCYADGKISFARLIGNGSVVDLRNKLLMGDPSGNALGHEFTSLTTVDPYVLLYAENDCSISGSIFSYTLPDSTTSTLIQDMTSVFPMAQANDITLFIYNNVYMNKIYTYDTSVNGYNFVTTGDVDACGNTVDPVCLDRGQKIRLDELRTLVGYSPDQLADSGSFYLEASGPFSIVDFVNENYSTKNGGPSMSLFDCYSIYGYTLSQIYDPVLAYNNEVFTNNNSSQNITQSLVDLAASTGNVVTSVNSMSLYDPESTKFTDFDIIYYLCEQDATDAIEGTKNIYGIQNFFPALSYDRIRATYFDFSSNNNTTAFEWAMDGTPLSGHPVISINTLTNNGGNLNFLSASDTNSSSNINNADLNHGNNNPEFNSSRGGYIYDILTMITEFSAYTPTDIAYYVLQLPKEPLTVPGNNGTGDYYFVGVYVTSAIKLNPIDLLNTSGDRYPLTPYKSFTKLELNGLYATDSQSNAPGKIASWTRLGINTFLPSGSDYQYLLYGTNIGADSSGNGIRGILHAITDASHNYSTYNPTDIAYLCLALEYSSEESTLVVPHDIGPNGSIMDNENNIFTRDEIRQLSFPTTNTMAHAGVTSITPDSLVVISEWEWNINEYDFVHEHDYSLLNVTDAYDYVGDSSGNVAIKYILDHINGYDTSNNSVSHKNIEIALNNIYMASNNLIHPKPVDLFDGGYYTRDEIRTSFILSESNYKVTFLNLQDDANSVDALYKLVYATDKITNNYYDINGAHMGEVLITEYEMTDVSERARTIRKMIYSSDFQDNTYAKDAKYHAQPWQLVEQFSITGIRVRQDLTEVTVPVYVAYDNSGNVTLPAVQSGILAPYYRNPSLGNYHPTFNHTYTLYDLNVNYGLNKDGEGSTYLVQAISNYIGTSLSPRQIAIELRLGAFDGEEYYPSVNNSYSLADVLDALNGVYPYTGFSRINLTSADAGEVSNQNIYITDYPVNDPSYYLKKNGTTQVTDASINLYQSNSSVTMWTLNDWNARFDGFTGKELVEDYGFSYNDVRDYFFSPDNGVVYNYQLGKFLTYGTYITNLLFARDTDVEGNTIALGFLKDVYKLSNLSTSNTELHNTTSASVLHQQFVTLIQSYVAPSIIGNDDTLLTEAILRFAYDHTRSDVDLQLLAVHGSNRVTTLKDIEFMFMGSISNTDTSTVNTGENPVSPANQLIMTEAFDINTFYNEVITYDSSTNAIVMNVNDFYHYWTRTNLHDYTMATDGSNNQIAPSILTIVDTYGSANNNVNFDITIDYFSLIELAKDNSIALTRVVTNYYGSYATNLDGKITTLNTRKPTGAELITAGTSGSNASWSIVNVRKLYYDISGNSNFKHATGYASTQYITFKNLVGAVYNIYDPTNDPSGNNIDASAGDYSLVYAQDYNLKSDMLALTNNDVPLALHLLVPYQNRTIALYATNVVKNTTDTSLSDNIRLDQLRTIVGFTSTQIKTAYDVEDIVSMADAGCIYTQATNNYWVPASDPYDTKWMTLKVEYGFTAIQIAQNSTTVIGTYLLNKTGTKNTGFTAAETRIGFFYNLTYYTNGNSGDASNNNTSDVGFTNYLQDPEFTTSSITKFAQMVNYGETASMIAQDSVNAYLIPAYSISESPSTNNNVGFYNLFKYLRALNISYAATKYTNSAYNLFKYMDTSNNTINGFLYDLNNLETIPNSYEGVYYGNIDSSQFASSVNNTVAEVNAYVKIVMFMKFELAPPNNIFIKNFYYSYLKTLPISIISDYFSSNAKTAQTLFLQNLFKTADIFNAKTVPELWNGGEGINVKTFVEYYESIGLSQTDIFAKLYPYIPLENLLGYRTYYGSTLSTIRVDSGQQSSDASGNANAKSGLYYYTNPLDTNNPKQRYATGSRWISVKTALEGMDGKWGVQWNSNGGYYTDNNSDAPSIDQVLTALSIIDGNSASTTPVYGIDPGTTKNYSYTTGQNILTKTSPVIQEIRAAYTVTDGSHNAIIGYNANNSSVNTYPTTDLSGNKPSIDQLVALITGQNIPLGFAKLIFVPTVIIRSSIYTRSEKRELFTGATDLLKLKDAYAQLNSLVSNTYTYTQTPTIVYYMDNHVIADLINLKFPISAYYNFDTVSPNPFTTYGLLTAYDTNVQGYDEDGFAINILGQLIWHNAVDRTNIIDTFEPGVSEYKYNPSGSNSSVNGPYGLDDNDNYYYAYPENITSLRDAYLIEQRNAYKADTRYGVAMSNDPNLNILIALKAIGIPATIALKFPVAAYSPFTNKNIGGDLTDYSYMRGTNTQSSVTNSTYNGGVNRNILNFTAYDLLSAHDTEQIDSDNLGFVFTSQDHLLWSTLKERDEIINVFTNTTNNLLKYNPTTNSYDADANGHYYFSYPQNLNDFGDLVGSRSTP